MKTLSTEGGRQRVTVLLQTGLRKSEFLGLRWKDVDLKAGVLTIPRSKNGETRHVPPHFDRAGHYREPPSSAERDDAGIPKQRGEARPTVGRKDRPRGRGRS
jgi:integrase